MLKKVLIALGVALVALLALIATRPSTYRVERSLTLAASAETTFPLINDFKHFISWSPWQKLDPGMKTQFSGPPQGQGSVYEWEGNDQVGQGRMTITESEPARRVSYKLEFLRPFESTATTDITLSPEGTGTKVTWAMQGENNFVSKAFTLVMDMDAMIGKDFEAGLASLKSLAEADATKAP